MYVWIACGDAMSCFLLQVTLVRTRATSWFKGVSTFHPTGSAFIPKSLALKPRFVAPSTHQPMHRDVMILNVLCFVAAANSCQHSSQHIAREDGHFYSERHRNPHNKRQSECNIWLPVSIKTTVTWSSCAWNLSVKVKNCVQSRCALIVEPVV